MARGALHLSQISRIVRAIPSGLGYKRAVKIVGIIPARYGSSRFPGKPLARIAGKPLIARVIERCQQAKALAEVIVATDDTRIWEVAQEFCRAEMTAGDHPSGSDRIAEVAAALCRRRLRQRAGRRAADRPGGHRCRRRRARAGGDVHRGDPAQGSRSIRQSQCRESRCQRRRPGAIFLPARDPVRA